MHVCDKMQGFSTPETCDDGNLVDNDACTNSCTPTYCGDGIQQTPNGTGAYEQCDHGVSNDGSTSVAGVICNNSCEVVCTSSDQCPNGACIGGVCSDPICL
jgi:cysteine-rich repeat protein